MSRSPLELVAATANPDKAAEIAAILNESGITLLPCPLDVPDVEETGQTLLENARLKVRALVEATNRAAIADDTGLEVEALGGAPGVWSARYAGEHATYADNVAKLLSALSSLPDAGGDRRARFRTVAIVRYPDGREVWREGAVDGYIAPEPAGNGGFGYDAVFVPVGSGDDDAERVDSDRRTFAEMSPAEKHAVSHRGRAFRALSEALTQ